MPAVTDPIVAFTEVEKKLVRLLLCPSAHPGEIDSAGRALISSWRRRGLDVETLLNPSGSHALPESPYASVILSFGKHRGKRLDAVPPDYLVWLLDNCPHIWPQTRTAIQRFLDQSNV